MLNRNLSISSRTGYDEQSLGSRIQEAVAILASMTGVVAVITAMLAVSRYF